jgi:cobalt/nickel transport protein
MKKALVFVGLVLVSLAVLLPFASSSPDGLEKVTGTFGVQQQTPIWQGLMPDYSVAALGNSYVSTLLAGIFGTLMVLLTTLLLGKVMVPKNGKIKEN